MQYIQIEKVTQLNNMVTPFVICSFGLDVTLVRVPLMEKCSNNAWYRCHEGFRYTRTCNSNSSQETSIRFEIRHADESKLAGESFNLSSDIPNMSLNGHECIIFLLRNLPLYNGFASFYSNFLLS